MFLGERNQTLSEAMDDPECDRQLLFNTYRQFQYINRLLSGWKSLYRDHIRPVLREQGTCTMLDIGFGGGDLPIALYKWARRDGFSLRITAIDTDPRALEFVQQHRKPPDEIRFKCLHTDQLMQQKVRYDFVISNHLIHHLSRQQLHTLADQSVTLSKQKVIFNDLQRSYPAYLLFSGFIAPFFRRSFAGSDGRLSIRRSFTQPELTALLPEQWEVYRLFPFRLIAHYNHE